MYLQPYNEPKGDYMVNVCKDVEVCIIQRLVVVQQIDQQKEQGALTTTMLPCEGAASRRLPRRRRMKYMAYRLGSIVVVLGMFGVMVLFTTTAGDNVSGRQLEEESSGSKPTELRWPNWFTLEEMQSGGVITHVVIMLYMFFGLALVCDEYFCSALDEICIRLQISDDVAGATFMAAGAP